MKSAPLMTREQFFDWAEAQDARYEFDGFQPVAMTGRTINHNRIAFNDRIVKVREYAAVPSILRYVIVESAVIGLTVMERQTGADKLTVTTRIADESLLLPEIGVEIPVGELYEGVDLPGAEADGG